MTKFSQRSLFPGQSTKNIKRKKTNMKTQFIPVSKFSSHTAAKFQLASYLLKLIHLNIFSMTISYLLFYFYYFYSSTKINFNTGPISLCTFLSSLPKVPKEMIWKKISSTILASLVLNQSRRRQQCPHNSCGSEILSVTLHYQHLTS